MSKYLPSGQSILKIGGSILAISFISLAGLLYKIQNKLIYVSGMPADSRTNVPLPSEFGMKNFKILDLKSPDGIIIKAYLIKAEGVTSSEEEEGVKRPTILFLHANAGNIGHRMPIIKIFVKHMRCNVLALSYRGYGHSEGEADEKGIKLDAQTALDYLLSDQELSKTPIFLYGQSIGGAVAIFLASQNKTRVQGLIVENTFTSLPKLVPEIMPFLTPFTFLMHQIWPSHLLIQTLPKNFSVLFLSGDKDELIPQHHMGELYSKCTSWDKTWRDFKHGTHNDTCIQPLYFNHITDFISRVTGLPSTSSRQASESKAFEKEKEKEKEKKVKSSTSSKTGSDSESFELIDRIDNESELDEGEKKEIREEGGSGSLIVGKEEEVTKGKGPKL